MKSNYTVTLRLSEDMMRKLLYVCEAENRTPSAQVTFMLRNSVAYMERAKGRIPAEKLKAIDLSPYEGDDGQGG